MKILLLLCLIIAVVSKFYVRNNRIYDPEGAQVIFHGLNLVEKVKPYYNTHLKEDDFIHWRKIGINGMRLGVMWPGVQPKQGEFNENYLQIMQNIVNMAAQHGIYTLVQFHQDLFSEKFCGDGVPIWAIPNKISKTFPLPIGLKKPFDQEGMPLAKTCQSKPWGQFYTTFAVNKMFNHLWKNKNGLLTKFARYWKKVALRFKDNPNVIAYELINQPWPGNMYKNIFNMIPGLSEYNNLQVAYDYLAREIRSVDPQQNICFEPVTWDNFIETGFTHPPGGYQYSNKSILCYHIYTPPVINTNSTFKARMKDIRKLKTGGLLSQFYVLNEHDSKHSQISMNLCQQYGQSWFGWVYNTGGDTIPFSERVNQTLVSRTYARRLAGQKISENFNTTTKKYSLSYYNCQKCGQTVIYFSKQLQYKQGYVLQCLPENKVTCVIEENNYLKVMSEIDKLQIRINIESLS